MFVCLCHAVSDRTIRDAIRAGARTVEAVGEACRAGTQCGKCRTAIEIMLLGREQVLVGPTGVEREAWGDGSEG